MTAARQLVRLESFSIRFAGNYSATVDALDFEIGKGEIVALVGESGSGKSLIAHTIAGILTPAAKVERSRFTIAGIDLRDPKAAGWRDLRGREIGIVFQNPRAALNPVRRVGQQLADVIAEHRQLRGAGLRAAVLEALASVRIADPERRMMAYPGELSGGLCQRVMLAIAMAGNPSLLIADEPTTGLDTTTQAAVLELIVAQARSREMACLLITHDLGIARQYAERVVVMHAGQIVEEATTEALFAAPRHPYSLALLRATPEAAARAADLSGIAGKFPDLAGAVPACRFADRCGRVIDRCRSERPPLAGESTHRAACWRPVA